MQTEHKQSILPCNLQLLVFTFLAAAGSHSCQHRLLYFVLLEDLDMSVFLLYDQVRQTKNDDIIMCININESIYHNRGVMTLAAIVRF